MPASSHASPTSGIRRTSSPQASQRIGTSSIQGRCSSWSWSSPPVARSSSSAREPITFSWPHVARVERQRQAEVALARDVPVAHVAQPVVHPLAVLRRRPVDGRVARRASAARISSQEMNQSSTTRKTSGVPQRQQIG